MQPPNQPAYWSEFRIRERHRALTAGLPHTPNPIANKRAEARRAIEDLVFIKRATHEPLGA